VEDYLFQCESQKLLDFQNQVPSAGMNDEVCWYCTILHNKECHDLIYVNIRYWHFSLDPRATCTLIKQHCSYLHTCINNELHGQIREEQSDKDQKESKKKETRLCRFSTRQ
jgi:hypothetical protein